MADPRTETISTKKTQEIDQNDELYLEYMHFNDIIDSFKY